MRQRHRLIWWGASLGIWLVGLVSAVFVFSQLGWQSGEALLLPLGIHSLSYLSPFFASHLARFSVQGLARTEAEKGKWWVRTPPLLWPLWISGVSLFLGVITLLLFEVVMPAAIFFWILGRAALLVVWIVFLGANEPEVAVVSSRLDGVGRRSLVFSDGKQVRAMHVRHSPRTRGEIQIVMEWDVTRWITLGSWDKFTNGMTAHRVERSRPTVGNTFGTEATLHRLGTDMERGNKVALSWVIGAALAMYAAGLAAGAPPWGAPIQWFVVFSALALMPGIMTLWLSRKPSENAPLQGNLEVGSTAVEWRGAEYERIRWEAASIESLVQVPLPAGSLLVLTPLDDQWSSVFVVGNVSDKFQDALRQLAPEKVTMRLPMLQKPRLKDFLFGGMAFGWVLLVAAVFGLNHLTKGALSGLLPSFLPLALGIFGVLLVAAVVLAWRLFRQTMGDFRVDEKGAQWGNRPVVPAAGVTLSAEGDGGISFDGLVKKGDGAKGLVLEGALFSLGASIQADLIAHALQAQTPRRIEEGTYRTVGRVVSEPDSGEAEEKHLSVRENRGCDGREQP